MAKTPHTRRGEPVVPIGHSPVTKGMVELAENQLREMHGQVTLPAPYTAVFHDWTDDPFGGGLAATTTVYPLYSNIRRRNSTRSATTFFSTTAHFTPFNSSNK